MDASKQSNSLPVQIALAGLRHYLEHGQRPTPQTPAIASLLQSARQAEDPAQPSLADLLCTRQSGCFVSYKQSGELRGCIGTIAATTTNILTEICRNTVAAGTEDPRFPPISIDELPTLTCSVDILGDAEPANFDELDVQRYGVIVSRGWRRGLLLPDLEGVDTPAYQVAIALQKAGIRPDEPYDLERFEVVRYS
jgi:AmmeMemoRadiSam system protein A